MKTPEDRATKRMLMIMPLLEEGIDQSELVNRKKKIVEQNNVSYRTISRYHEAYLKNEFEGLKPKATHTKNQHALSKDFPMVLETAIDLRRECPTRSVRDIIKIMELENTIEKGTIHRSTLQRHLHASGFGSKQMRIYTKKGAASRRFEKSHRCQLYQGDIKYGPCLPIGKNGAKKQVYLAAFIDDATRFIVSARFYDNQRVEIIEDTLRTAVMTYGKPDAIYVDNGKQYRSDWLKNSCAKLNIKLLFAKPYHPEGKGKIEAFNRRLDSFLSEVALMDVKTLDHLNELLSTWIEQHYHKEEHYGLGMISPGTAFKTDTRPLKFIDIRTCAKAFLHQEQRKVDKTGCISFDGKKYDVGVQLIGRIVAVHYDVTWRGEIEIHHKDFEPFKVKELVIGQNCGVKSTLPERMMPVKSDGSRLLEGLVKASSKKKESKGVAVIFGKNQEVRQDV